MTRPAAYLRLEPARPAGDPQRGFAAELGDPAWMVGRQWQMGEHQGENASTPLEVTITARDVPIAPLAGREGWDPALVPGEAIVEAGPADWWTVGRRLRLGRAAHEQGLTSEKTLFTTLTGPYAVLNGQAHDGRAVYGDHADHAVFAEVPAAGAAGPDCWQTDALVYVATLACGGTTLHVGGKRQPGWRTWVGHDGGDLDWWSVDAGGPVVPPEAQGQDPPVVFPTRFRWPGAPADRWWQIEDHLVDVGGLPPDRAHVTSLFLLDLVLTHGDDWFLFPVDSKPGHVLCVESVTIRDSFGEVWSLTLVPDQDDRWQMFAVEGLDPHQLALWVTATDRLVGEPVEVVSVGIDEDANVAWAVEEVLNGAPTVQRSPSPEPAHVVAVPGNPAFQYLVATDVPNHWHPYLQQERDGELTFVQGRLAGVEEDGSLDLARSAPPDARLLQGGNGVHTIDPVRLPPDGLRLESRPVLARAADGSPVLWVQRRRQPLLSAPTSGLRFDALRPADEA